ncbi:MAG: type II toxin-antitoxin system Phd/YefM family antitoxin [Caldilineae bacterium]|nr:MAG: type II toxin-antitoxin system Phd/YefM family antitoxin [Caldilineae bacterium]
MERVVSATEARTRLGELMRRVAENQETVVIERGGQPYVAVISLEEYERLQRGTERNTWQEALRRLLQVGAEIRAAREEASLPPPDEVIREMREERDAQLAGLR